MAIILRLSIEDARFIRRALGDPELRMDSEGRSQVSSLIGAIDTAGRAEGFDFLQMEVEKSKRYAIEQDDYFSRPV